MTEEKPQVRVLMATFNGMPYLEEQIASILAQKNVRIAIEVLDDGSTDGTYQYLENELKRGKIASLYKSNRIGHANAFLQLVKRSKPADFYAFSDQDDIWHSHKLEKQTESCIREQPCLVVAKRGLIDAQGKRLPNKNTGIPKPFFANAIVQNIAYGNTQLFNEKMRKLILQTNTEVRFLDAWIYLIASSFGEIKFINEELVDYRLHSENAVGIARHSMKRMYSSVVFSKIQLQSFLKTFPDISTSSKFEARRYLEVFNASNIAERFIAVWRSPAKRQSRFQTLIWNLFLLVMAKKQP